MMKPRIKVIHSTTGDEQIIFLEAPRFTIGRSGENDLQTNDPSVSRHHAEIIREGENFRVVDKGSKCGTFVNATRIQNQVLAHQDRVLLGNETTLIFLLGEDHATTDAGFVPDAPSIIMSFAGSDLRNVSKLLETARLFSGALPLGEILDLVLDMAIEVTSAERGFLVLKDETGEARFQRGRDRSKQSIPEDDFHVSTTILKQVMDTGQKVLMSDVQGPKKIVMSESMLNLELRSIACLPLQSYQVVDSSTSFVGRKDVLGALYLDSKKATESFSKISQGILDSLATDATGVIENARLLKESREKERLETELATAHEIQATLLPKIRGAYKFFSACAQNIPSRHISGDYYDLIKLSEDRYGFVIADVSGKGISAALLCSMAQGLLYAEAQRYDSLATCLESVNKYIVQRTNSNKFITLFYGVISSNGELRYVNAGHNPPYIIRSNGSLEELYSASVVLGAFDFAKYEEKSVQLQPGDLICLFTDGVTEARSKKGDLLGDEELKKILHANRFKNVVEVVANVFDAVREHAAGVPQSDDISVFVVRYTATAEEPETLH